MVKMIRDRFKVYLFLGFLLVGCTEPASERHSIPQDSVQKEGRNRLGEETSPYLLLHKSNPVHWYAWGKEAFEAARKENKPIFLSVGYSTCYWCHVMERQSFANQAIADILNKHFIAIKVDREERPDVDEIYMAAVQMLTGRGGWPMSMFLTPDLMPFHGGTYFPREQFSKLLHSVAEVWEQNEKSLQEKAVELATQLKFSQAVPSQPSVFPVVGSVATSALNVNAGVDSEFGGFGTGRNKFPQPSRLELLIEQAEQSGNKDLLGSVSFTLKKMAMGGIYDHIGGGFHRYSTDREWQIPHFEKMLYDNAQLLHVYTRAYQLTQNKQFARVSRDIIRFIKREFLDKSGMFYSALDAETDEEEGKYYRWDLPEIKSLLSGEEYKAVAVAWGLDQTPNFDGHYVMSWRKKELIAVAHELGTDESKLRRMLDQAGLKLLSAREKRERPLLDDKIMLSWNSLMVEAMASAGTILKEPELLQIATMAADALWQQFVVGSSLHHVARAGQAKLPAFLDDYAAFILANLELYTQTQGSIWRARAEKLADWMIASLWDEASGGFFYSSADLDELIVRPRKDHDGAFPSGNSLAARALVKISKINAGYLPYAHWTIRSHAAELSGGGTSLSYMAWALSDYRREKFSDQLPRPEAVGNKSTESAAYIEVTDIVVNDRRVSLSITMAKGWHINANPASYDFLIPTRLRSHLNDGSFKPVYPPGISLPVAGGRANVLAYESNIVIKGEFANAITDLVLSVQACSDDGTCLAPSDVTIGF